MATSHSGGGVDARKTPGCPGYCWRPHAARSTTDGLDVTAGEALILSRLVPTSSSNPSPDTCPIHTPFHDLGVPGHPPYHSHDQCRSQRQARCRCHLGPLRAAKVDLEGDGASIKEHRCCCQRLRLDRLQGPALSCLSNSRARGPIFEPTVLVMATNDRFLKPVQRRFI